ncbi:MAG: phosphate signaling complex protein PhoU [Clostridiales bacterium]|nr:phosphate signaling complex protein PhoU [Clostridiales bacterium]
MRAAYNEQLELLHKELVAMGDMCEEAISNAVHAIANKDEELINRVYTVDAEIDRKEREIENMCLKLLLRQQPVAHDLRDISSALKMISDMERIGDQASDIAGMAKYIMGHAGKSVEDIKSMSAEAVKMVTDSIDSFVKRDLALARFVIAYDDVVDKWFDRIKAEVIENIVRDGGEGEYYIDLLMIAKYLERIADHATNIAEWVEYAITGARSKDGVFPE